MIAALLGIVALWLVFFVGAFLCVYVMARGYWPWQRYERWGCCGACDGTGRSMAAPETNGKCWDCYGTGHAHAGRCIPWWRRRSGAHRG